MSDNSENDFNNESLIDFLKNSGKDIAFRLFHEILENQVVSETVFKVFMFIEF